MNTQKRWAFVKCDYLCEDDMFWRVDAWRTENEGEEGCVIAYIDDLTGRVIYTDPVAQIDEGVQALIKEKISEIEERPIRVRYQNGNFSIQYKIGM